MKKLKISDLKKVTKVAAPVERTVQWVVDVTEENLDFLRKLTENDQLNIGDVAELEGEVYIKRLTFEEQQEVTKAYRWDKDQKDEIKLKDINMNQMFAAQLMGSVCEDKKGTPFFTTLKDVYSSDPKFIDALYKVADEVNKFLGKSKNQNLTKTNSSVSLSSTESVEEPLAKPSGD